MIDTWGAPQWTNLVAEPVYTPVAYGWKAFLIITLNHFSTNPYPILSHIFGHSCIPNMHPYLGTKFQNFSKFKMDSFSFSWTHLVVCATLYATSPPSESKSLLLRLIYRPHYYPVFFLQWRREGGNHPGRHITVGCIWRETLRKVRCLLNVEIYWQVRYGNNSISAVPHLLNILVGYIQCTRLCFRDSLAVRLRCSSTVHVL